MSNDNQLVSIGTNIESLQFDKLKELMEHQKANCNHTCQNCNKDKRICDAYVIAYRDKLLCGESHFDGDGYCFPVEGLYGEQMNYAIRCHQCGKTFRAYSFRRFYCSYRCRNDAWIVRRREYNKQRRNKICLFCKKPFTAKSRKACFCSLKHRVAFFRQKKRNDSKLLSIDSNPKSLQVQEVS